MKLSLKFQGQDDQQHQNTTHLMAAKFPVTIFNHPFLSAITASSTTTPNSASDFSFSLSTNFPSGPSLKLSYSATASTTSSLPFSLSLKSGLGLLGCPRNSPLVFSANFSLSPSFAPIPSFFLHFKPQFGHFSLNKTLSSRSADPTNDKPYSPTPPLHDNNNNHNNNNNGEIGKGFVSDGSSSGWQELRLEPFGGGTVFVPESSLVEKNPEKRGGVWPGVAVMARTVMPVTKGLLLNMRWGVNFPRESVMPYLTVNKIGLERVVEEPKQNKKKQGNEASDSDLQLLKGMCYWMKRDLEIVEKENSEMKRVLDEMRIGVSTRNYNGVGRKSSSQQQNSGENQSSSEFERWRSKKSGVREENEKKEARKQQSVASDVESELHKAIKAASSS